MLNSHLWTIQYKSKNIYYELIYSNSVSKGLAFDRVIHWRRPHEFMEIDGIRGLYEPVVYSS